MPSNRTLICAPKVLSFWALLVSIYMPANYNCMVEAQKIQTYNGSIVLKVDEPDQAVVVVNGNVTVDLLSLPTDIKEAQNEAASQLASLSTLQSLAVEGVYSNLTGVTSTMYAQNQALLSGMDSMSVAFTEALDGVLDELSTVRSNLDVARADASGASAQLSRAVRAAQQCATNDRLFDGTGCVGVRSITDLTTCSAANIGRFRYNNASNAMQICQDPPFWDLAARPVTGSEGRPAQSCIEVKEQGQGSGIYWIRPGTSGTPFRVYCDNTRVGGGWTLVLKIAANHGSPWQYSSSLWTSSTSELNPSSLNLNNGDFKGTAYGRVPFTQIRMVMGNSYSDGFVENPGQRTSAHSLFNVNSRYNSRFGRGNFISIMESVGVSGGNWNNQPHCNVGGFNLQVDNGHRCRWGIIMNNENDCHSADAAIGMGCYTNDNSQRIGSGGFRWNPDQRWVMQSWVLVR